MSTFFQMVFLEAGYFQVVPDCSMSSTRGVLRHGDIYDIFSQDFARKAQLSRLQKPYDTVREEQPRVLEGTMVRCDPGFSTYLNTNCCML